MQPDDRYDLYHSYLYFIVTILLEYHQTWDVRRVSKETK